MAAVPDPRILGELPLFRGLSREELTALDEVLRRRVVPAQVPIILAGQTGEVVYVVLDGAVKVQLEQEGGANVILAVLGRGELVGEVGAIDGLDHTGTVVALEATTVLWMARDAFWDCLRAMPRMADNLLGILSRRLRRSDERVGALATFNVRARVACHILALASDYGRPAADGGVQVPFRLTQGELAGLVGASRVRVNQALVAYKRRRLISVDDGSRITVHNSAELARRCR